MVSPKSKKSPGDLKVQAIVQKAEIMARRLADSVLGVALKDPRKWGARQSPRHENIRIRVPLLDALFVSERVCIVRVPYSLGDLR